MDKAFENVMQMCYTVNNTGKVEDHIMNKAATINARIEPALKHNAEAILHHVGLSTAEAIRIFYIQICLKKGLPFEVKLPNEETLAAIQELESGKGAKYNSMEEVWSDLKGS